MKKQIIVLITLLIIPMCQGIQIEEIESYNTDGSIKNFYAVENGYFASTNNIKLEYLSHNDSWTKDFYGGFPNSIDANSQIVAIGTRKTNTRLLVFSRNGTKLIEKSLYPEWSTDVSVFERENNSFISISAETYTSIYDLKGNKVAKFSDDGLNMPFKNELHDINNDSTPEILVEGRNGQFGRGKFKAFTLDGSLAWGTKFRLGDVKANYVPGKGVLLYYNNKLEMRTGKGKLKWKKSTKTKNIDPLTLENFFIHSNSTHLVYRDYRGNKFNISKLEEKIDILEKFPDRNMLVAKQGDNLSFFSLKGQKLGTKKFQGLVPTFQFRDKNNDSEKELIFGYGNNLKAFEVDSGFSLEPVETPNRYAYIGDSREILKLIALNKTVFIGEDTNKFISETYRDLIKVDKSLDHKSISKPNKKLNVSKPLYYVNNTKKAVYVSALAAKNDAGLTFSRREADKDFSNYTVKDLQRKFIEKFNPHHIAVADLDSEKGYLTAYMAVKQGIIPIDFNSSYSYPDSESFDVERQNEYNGVIQLEEDIRKTFEMIGDNPNTVLDHQYISLVDAPRKFIEDPVDGIFGDEDEYYSSDLDYGKLNGDNYLDAGIGRYPENLSLASKLYHRSLVRNDQKKALVASSYMTKSWPETLANGGGGLKYGTGMENLFKRQDYDTTHLVEYRANPVSLLMNLAPASIRGFMGESDTLKKQIAPYVTRTTAAAFKDSLIIIRGLSYTDEMLKSFYEHKWWTAEFDLDRGLREIKDMDIPKGKTPNEIVQKALMKLVYESVWPERHPKLNSTNLEDRMKNKDIIYYQGYGDRDGWDLPSYTHAPTYNEKFKSYRIPKLDRPIVWDNSDRAGTKESEMRQKFLEKGASSYLGFSAINYPIYSSLAGNKFFRKGKTLGSSMVKSLNSLRAKEDVFRTPQWHETGKRMKTVNSLVMYGNPEMWKDPIDIPDFETEKSCLGTTCTLEVVLKPDYSIREFENKTSVSFNTTKFLKQPGYPITPIYSTNLDIPESSIENIQTRNNFFNRSDITLPKKSSIRFSNVSNYIQPELPYPVNSSRYKKKENSIKLIQSATKSFKNTTSILNKSKYIIKYEPKAVLNLRVENQSLKAKIYANQSFKAKIYYNLNQSKKVKRVNLEVGKNSFKLGKLPKKKSNIKGFIYSNNLIDSDSETFYINKKPKISLKSKNALTQESPSTLKFEVRNPNSFHLNHSFSIQTDHSSRLGFMEEKKKNVKIKPNSTKIVEFKIIGNSPGNSTIFIGNNTFKLKINSNKPDKNKNTIKSILKQFKNSKREINYQTKRLNYEVSLKTKEGSLFIRKTPEKSVEKIKTQNFSAKKIKEKDNIIKQVKTSSNYKKVRIKNGLKYKSGNIDSNKFNHYLNILHREIDKFKTN